MTDLGTRPLRELWNGLINILLKSVNSREWRPLVSLRRNSLHTDGVHKKLLRAKGLGKFFRASWLYNSDAHRQQFMFQAQRDLS